MPFYFRKSVSAGPFRFNFSKSGMGVSVGVRGLRVGTGPRGHYIRAGVGGFQYRASLNNSGASWEGKPKSTQHEKPVEYFDSGVTMVEIESGNVLDMADEKFSDLLKEMNSKNRKPRKSRMFLIFFLVMSGISFEIHKDTTIILLVLSALGFLVGAWLDSFQRRAVLFYDLDETALDMYERMVKAFDGLVACRGKWHVEAGGAVHDLHTWKRNAGATHIVKKKATIVGFGAPSVIATNIDPPMAQVGRQTVYFLPDVVLVVDGDKVGAVGYHDLKLRWQDSNFIETGTVPSDAKIIGQTWKHPNKKGGPDRRFANNHQIPICQYEVLHLSSPTGLNELLEFSQTGVSAIFANAVDGLRVFGDPVAPTAILQGQ